MSNQSKRVYLKRSIIRAYWADQSEFLDRKGIPREDLLEVDACWACGKMGGRERAHIVPRCNGGLDEASNMHLLCSTCHYDSEHLEGEDYWEWFYRMNVWVRFLIDSPRLGFSLDKIKRLSEDECNRAAAMLREFMADGIHPRRHVRHLLAAGIDVSL